MHKKVRMIMAFAIGGLFLLLDQGLKYLARTNPESARYALNPWLGWEYFENKGIAFSLPFPNLLLIAITPFIIFFLIRTVVHKKTLTSKGLFGISLIVSGAVSNFIDRVVFGFTVDYLRVITSVLNLADLMIVAGAMLVIVSARRPGEPKL